MARGKKVKANHIPEKQYNRFKDKLIDISKEKFKDRNLMLFILGVATGYRSQDIVDLTIGQIQDAILDGEFEIQEKKQYRSWLNHIKENPNSDRKAPEKRVHSIEGPLEKLLKNYIKGKKRYEYAFQSQKGQHITAKAFSEILSKVAKDKEINLKNISGHSMRKTYARRLWEAKKDLEFVRVALNHKSIEVTKEYLGLEEDVKMDAARIAADKI